MHILFPNALFYQEKHKRSRQHVFSVGDYFLACSSFIIYSLMLLLTPSIKRLRVSIKTTGCIHSKRHSSTYFHWKALIFAAKCLSPFYACRPLILSEQVSTFVAIWLMRTKTIKIYSKQPSGLPPQIN